MKGGTISIVDAFREYGPWLEAQHASGRYSSASFNRKLSAVRGVLRHAFTKGPRAEILSTSYRLEDILAEVPRKKVEPLLRPESALDMGEVRALVSQAKDARIRLMIAFLVGTGVRISEMLGLRWADLTVTEFGFSEARLVGRDRKTRTIPVKGSLLDRVRETFGGSEYLFEHHGQPYHRISVTNRIKYEGLRTIGREVTAQQLRHSWAMIQIQRGKTIRSVARPLPPEEAFLDVSNLEVVPGIS